MQQKIHHFFSAVKIRREKRNFIIEDEIDIFIDPGYPIPENITALTGITNFDMVGAKNKKEGARIIRDFLGEHPILMGYNSISFDQNFLNSLYKKVFGTEFVPSEHLDVFTMAKEKSERPFKLIHQAELAGVADKFQFHRSIDDAKATFEVFKYLLPRYEKKEVHIPVNIGQVTLLSATRWKKFKMDRIYLSNRENVSVYLDVPTRCWYFDGTPVDIPEIEKEAFRLLDVDNIDDFIKKTS